MCHDLGADGSFFFPLIVAPTSWPLGSIFCFLYFSWYTLDIGFYSSQYRYWPSKSHIGQVWMKFIIFSFCLLGIYLGISVFILIISELVLHKPQTAKFTAANSETLMMMFSHCFQITTNFFFTVLRFLFLQFRETCFIRAKTCWRNPYHCVKFFLHAK